MNTTDLFGNTYTVMNCSNEDVNKHLPKVSFGIAVNNIPKLKERMLKAIEQNTAFKLEDDSCFFYYLKETIFISDGVSFYGKDASYKLIALFKYVFNEIDNKTRRINFYAHKGTNISDYRNFVTLTSLKKQITPGNPLVIRVDKYKEKINSLYEKRDLL